jgi:hypothetical protein
MTKIGSAGEAPGQFRAMHGLAVDGKSRVYVSDTKGIQVFDDDGRYLGVIPVRGAAFGLAFNDKDELFVGARSQVLKYVLTQP